MPGYTVDVDVLRDSIERCIMADRQKADLTMTPRDLYVKSNPGLLGTGTDVTNPRDWYCSTATRKLIRNFVTQYNNAQQERFSGNEGLSKKMAFYVNFPALMKESSSLGEHHTSRQQLMNVSTGPSGHGEEARRLQHGGVSGQLDVDVTNKGAHHPDRKEQEVLPVDMLSSVGRMKSFTFSLPAVEPIPADDESLDHRSEGRDPPPSEQSHSVTLPKLSKRTVTFNIENRQSEPKEDPFELWLAGLPTESNGGGSHHHSRSRIGRRFKKLKKLDNLSSGKDVVSSRVIPHQYVELLLPKHEAELTEAQDFHDKYPWRQKSVLNLKLDFAKERPRHRSQERYAESRSPDSEYRAATTDNKRRPRMGGSHTKAAPGLSRSMGGLLQGESHRPSRGTEILGFFPHAPNEPAMEVISAAVMAKGPDVTAVPVDCLEKTEQVVTARSDQVAPTRYVYKVPADGFLQQHTSTKCTKTNIVTLGLTQEEQDRLQRKLDAGLSSLVSNHTTADPAREDTEHQRGSDGKGQCGSPQSDPEGQPLKDDAVLPNGQPKPKAPLKRYKVLEVFGERKPSLTDPRGPSGGGTATPVEVAPSITSERSGPTRSYKPMTRPPTYRLDERDYSEVPKAEPSLTVKVKVGNAPRDRRGHVNPTDAAGSSIEDVQINEPCEKMPLTDSVLVIEKLNTEREAKPLGHAHGTEEKV